MANSKKITSLAISRNELFSENDIDYLTYHLMPKTKKNLALASAIFVLIIPVMPFFPSKGSRKILVQSMSYDMALLVSTFLISLIILAIYYHGIVKLKRDINEGNKYIFETSISRKNWKGSNEFELVLRNKPKEYVSKIVIKKEEYYNWTVGDVIEVQYLKHSGNILSFNKKNNS